MTRSNNIDLNPELLAAAAESKAWPFEEAKKIVERYKKTGFPETVLFETGYGPSGLPHIGTFGEVARTTMVRHAFRRADRRQGQDPAAVLLRRHGRHAQDSRQRAGPRRARAVSAHAADRGARTRSAATTRASAHHNNAMLRRFLDTFGFDYEFASATEYYKSGQFDAMLLRAAERYDEIMDVMLPTLGEERQATYSPFLPISPTSGRVLYVPMKNVDAKAGTITFDDEDGTETTLSVTGGKVKLQWKPDFGMRWAALGVDFEMFGKDHQTNAVIYDRICNILGGRAPEHFVYELFLDENGQKISKSKGNGLTIDEWLTYAPTESLGLYMFQRPRQAKKLYFDVIPKAVDEYYSFLSAYPKQDWKNRLGNPVWHMHGGNPPAIDLPVPFALLLNLVSVSNAHDKERAVGLHLALCARCDRRNASRARPPRRLCDPLLRRFREADQDLSRARRGRASRRSTPSKRHSANCLLAPTAKRSRTPRSTSPARSSATRIIPSRARRAGPACPSPSSR